MIKREKTRKNGGSLLAMPGSNQTLVKISELLCEVV